MAVRADLFFNFYSSDCQLAYGLEHFFGGGAAGDVSTLDSNHAASRRLALPWEIARGP